MKKEINLDNYDRKFQLNYFGSKTNPFGMITIKLDITNIVSYCKIHKNYYATLGYVISSAVNEIDAFKYRMENGKLYRYENLRICFTNIMEDKNVGFYSVDYNDNFNHFIDNYKKIYNEFMNGTYTNQSDDHGEIWLSCEPWFEFLSLVPPFDRTVTIPQFIWSKFYTENERTYTNLMIMAYHGFVDGSHLGEFVDKLKNKIEKFSKN